MGEGLNYPYYRMSRIKKLVGLDWVARSKSKAEQKAEKVENVAIIACDVHKMPFKENSFDSVIDTFGLECTYDLERAYAEVKRVAKPGGKILLLERGLGFWMIDNFMLMQKASVNLGARG